MYELLETLHKTPNHKNAVLTSFTKDLQGNIRSHLFYSTKNMPQGIDGEMQLAMYRESIPAK